VEKIEVFLPDHLSFLVTKKARYKIMYGGRGGAKGHSSMRGIVIRCMRERLFVMCAREVMNTIKDSTHRLIKSIIRDHGMEDAWHITDYKIVFPKTKSEIGFMGLKQTSGTHNLKSLEDVDICVITEAENLSESTIDILSPTIRKPGSEIWIEFNPQLETDPVWKEYVANPKADSIVVETNLFDNPWRTKELEDEYKEDCQRRPEIVAHKWLGKPKAAGQKYWKRFDKKVHVREFRKEWIYLRGNCFMAMDPHSSFYPFVVWGAIVPKWDFPDDYDYVIYDEWPTTVDLAGQHYYEIRKKIRFPYTIKEFQSMLYRKDETDIYGHKIYKRVVDTRFVKSSGGENFATASQGMLINWAKPENGGMVLTPPPESLIDGAKDVIEELQTYNITREVGMYNEPHWFVTPNCHNVIQSLYSHHYEEKKGDSTERQSETHKDPSDAIRILQAGMHGWQYRDPIEDMEKRKPRKRNAINPFKYYKDLIRKTALG
jgi:hypothetical protein